MTLTTGRLTAPMIVRRGRHEGIMIANGVMDCETCGFAHLDPLPTQAELDKHYREVFYQSHPDYFKEYEEDAEWWREQADEILDRIGLEPLSRVLDYGSGPGWFADAAFKRGMAATGFEPSVSAMRYAREHSKGDFGAYDPFLWEDPFDAIVLYQVLEHLRDPADTLKRCHEKLTNDGWLVVCVPNDFNPLQKAIGGSHWVSAPEHVNYFNPGSLQKLIAQCGFTVVDVHMTFPMEWFILMGWDYRNDPKLGRECHHRRVAFEKRLGRELKREMYRGLGRAGIGREVIVYARKG